MRKSLSLVNKILLLQLITVALVCVVFSITLGISSVINPFLGGVAAFLPNLYFAIRVSRSKGQDPKKIVNSFYAGESGKLILTAALFIVIFQLPNISFLPLMAGYVSVLSIFWVALLLRE